MPVSPFPYVVVDTYFDGWLTRLVKGDPVYRVTDESFAFIEVPYVVRYPRTHGYRGSGDVVLKYTDGSTSRWIISPNGTGNNGSQCLLPVHLTEEREVETPLRAQVRELTDAIVRFTDISLRNSNNVERLSVTTLDRLSRLEALVGLVAQAEANPVTGLGTTAAMIAQAINQDPHRIAVPLGDLEEVLAEDSRADVTIRAEMVNGLEFQRLAETLARPPQPTPETRFNRAPIDEE